MRDESLLELHKEKRKTWESHTQPLMLPEFQVHDENLNKMIILENQKSLLA